MDMIGQQRKLFEELWQLDPGVIEDGVSDEAQYTSAAYRIMYVLKEVNGGSGWSLCDHLRSGGRDYNGGLDQILLQLADVLPWQSFADGV